MAERSPGRVRLWGRGRNVQVMKGGAVSFGGRADGAGGRGRTAGRALGNNRL